MLRHLHVQNLALLESVSIDFSPGMTALTGETGSGKSLLIDSLSLLAGARSSPSLVRTGTERATVEAVLDVPAGSDALALLESLGLESADSGEVIIRREVFASGRGRASINGRLVPLNQLAEVAAHLIDVGGQHEQQSLLEPAHQRDLFDAFAGTLPLRRRVEQLHHTLIEKSECLEAHVAGEKEREQRRDFLAYQVAELEELELRDGELAELETEVRRLSNIAAISAGASKVRAMLCEGDGDAPTALDLVGAALPLLDDLGDLDPAFAPFTEALREVQARLSDIGFDIGRQQDRTEDDPTRVDEVIARCEAIRRALRKHGPTEADAIVALEGMKEELDRIENWDGELARLEEEIATARAELLGAARELSAKRGKLRKRFVSPLVEMLREFALPAVRVELDFRVPRSGVELEGGAVCGPGGLEEVEILFSANAGESPQPLRRIASGGELSRVMLALRTMDAEASGAPVMVFDEVDAGISGTAARKVAERLAALGQRCQVFCVTHNPSVASAADHHLLVEKREVKGRTASQVDFVVGLRREGELARLLDGGKRSEKGLALAAEMLERAG